MVRMKLQDAELYLISVHSIGAEGFLTSLLDRLEFDLAMSISSLHCLKLDSNVRKRAAEALVPSSKMKVGNSTIPVNNLARTFNLRTSFMFYLSHGGEL